MPHRPEAGYGHDCGCYFLTTTSYPILAYFLDPSLVEPDSITRMNPKICTSPCNFKSHGFIQVIAYQEVDREGCSICREDNPLERPKLEKKSSFPIKIHKPSKFFKMLLSQSMTVHHRTIAHAREHPLAINERSAGGH